MHPLLSPRQLGHLTICSFTSPRQLKCRSSWARILLEIVYPDISVDTDNETCPRCNFLLSDDDVVAGWTPSDSQDYTTSCPNCTQRFVPHFHVQSTSATFMGSRGPASPLLCERLSPWVLQKEIRTVMSDREGIENLLSPEWREAKKQQCGFVVELGFVMHALPLSILVPPSGKL